jgi:hypothetical protein
MCREAKSELSMRSRVKDLKKTTTTTTKEEEKTQNSFILFYFFKILSERSCTILKSLRLCGDCD